MRDRENDTTGTNGLKPSSSDDKDEWIVESVFVGILSGLLFFLVGTLQPANGFWAHVGNGMEAAVVGAIIGAVMGIYF